MDYKSQVSKIFRFTWTLGRQINIHYIPIDHIVRKTVKNAKNMKSVSKAKLPFFEGIFKR